MATGVALQAPVSLDHSGNFGKLPALSQSTATRLPHEMIAPPMKTGTHGAHGALGTRHQQAPSGTIHLSVSESGEKTDTAIASYLQVPSSINSSKGSLAEFAAQIACFFWFHAASKLNMVETGMSQSVSLSPPVSESIPSIGFRKWLTTMLSTTQVSQNVILLALLFIYRLKMSNPGVKGKRGSEFRLMTIALMMGNKFLDDATYLNKTWADVSGISMQEIHLMEVEFLSNIRYNLFVSHTEWQEWLEKLSRFSAYLDRSSQMRPNDRESTVASTWQSPYATTTQPSAHYTQSSRLSQHPNAMARTAPDYFAQLRYNPSATRGQHHTTKAFSESVDPLTRNRKRCREAEPDLYASKRMATGAPMEASPPFYSADSASWHYTVPPFASQTAAAPNPNNRTMIGPTVSTVGVNAPSFTSQLPLHSTGVMPMSYVVPTSWDQSSFPQVTLGSLPPSSQLAVSCNVGALQRQIPGTASASTISPLPAYSAHATPVNLSPSAILDRNSPYRPVRGVNTLLRPPPPTSLNQPRKLSVDEIHYQALSKPVREQKSGVKSGVLPYYYQPDAWSYAFPSFNNAGPLIPQQYGPHG